jgi:8-oxo-dGTP pyrophosphatase MutT (NUDIX family)
MPTPDFVLELRKLIGHRLLWLTTAGGVVLDGDGRVLLARRADTGAWSLPGGIVDPGEQPADAAVREVFEETGVIAVPEVLTAVTVSEPITYPNGDIVQYLELTFRCRAVGGKACVNDAESLEVGWHPLDALPDVDDFTRSGLASSLAGSTSASFAFSGIDQVIRSAESPGRTRQ